MIEQPFKDEEVLWRHGPTGDECVVAEQGLHCQCYKEHGQRWRHIGTLTSWMVTILRELTAARQERDRLAAVMQSAAIILRQEFAGADAKEMEMAFGIADSLSASIAQPYPAEQGMSDKGKPPQPSGAMKEREYVNTDQM